MSDYIKREYAERAMLDNCDIEFLGKYRIDREKDDFYEIQPFYEAVLDFQQSLSLVPSADAVERAEVGVLFIEWLKDQAEDMWKYFALEDDNNLTAVAKTCKDMLLYGYEKCKAERKRGERIKYYEYYEELDQELWYGYICSLCGRWEGNAEPYCNCGADMRGSDND